MRYLVLLLLNLPIVLLALVNTVTLYKLKKISKQKFRHQVLIWFGIFVVVAGSFPAFNWISGRPLFASENFSTFDIVQTTVIVYLLYILNKQRQRIDNVEKIIRDLHTELSIKLSEKKK